MTQTTEAPQLTDTGEVEEFLCHLYFAGEHFAFCGIHENEDAHCRMHHDHEQVSPDWKIDEGPGTNCPVCGAPICPDCLKEA